MEQGGTVLEQHAILYADIVMGKSLGEGAFGTVYKGTLLRRAASSLGTAVAVKTMRVDKVTPSVVRKAR